MLAPMRYTGLAVILATAALLVGCGSSSSSSGNPSNASKIGAAETASSESQSSIELKLENALHPYKENGEAEATTFDVAGGGTCSLEGVHVGDDAKAFEGEPESVFAPNNAAAVKVSAENGGSEAACLKAVAAALHWEQ